MKKIMHTLKTIKLSSFCTLFCVYSCSIYPKTNDRFLWIQAIMPLVFSWFCDTCDIQTSSILSSFWLQSQYFECTLISLSNALCPLIEWFCCNFCTYQNIISLFLSSLETKTLHKNRAFAYHARSIPLFKRTLC